MQKDTDYLFVYGSLLSSMEHPMHMLLSKGATYIAKGYFQGKLYDLGEYPGAVVSDDASDTVKGELYLLHNKSIIGSLDEYEGYEEMNPDASLFIRNIVSVTLPDGILEQAFIYLYNSDVSGKSLIWPGDYFLFKQIYFE